MSENSKNNSHGLDSLVPKKIKRNKTREMMEILPDIEAALKRGIRHLEILDHLNSKGFDLTMTCYTNKLFKVRAKVRRAEQSTGVVPILPVQEKAPVPVPKVTTKISTEPKRVGAPVVFNWDEVKRTKVDW